MPNRVSTIFASSIYNFIYTIPAAKPAGPVVRGASLFIILVFQTNYCTTGVIFVPGIVLSHTLAPIVAPAGRFHRSDIFGLLLSILISIFHTYSSLLVFVVAFYSNLPILLLAFPTNLRI